jgi:hypothetical protein
MIRPLTVGALCLTAAVSIGLYALSYDVQRLEGVLADTNADLLQERELVQVLNAEWSFLNQPERLRALAARNLDLAPVEPHQIATLQELPFRNRPGDRPEGGPPLPRRKPNPPMAELNKPGRTAVLASAWAEERSGQ